MKLIIVTTVQAFHKDAIKLFKKAGIESFSVSEIGGYKNSSGVSMTESWFGSERSGNESSMLFSFTNESQVDMLFDLIKAFNLEQKETNNPLRAIVVPIEKYI
ncbi:hypothetical protein [uncultured Psychroserpens sp.]|uniref:hypothetical protein n=1 Tax=uncultured Psychroserpens sp. TaxID=255436 RepID=UPI0026232095|nr:hypothetical protein [uncultured Psychroserpens sp.]